MSKLSKAERAVLRQRRREGASVIGLAREYNLSPSTVSEMVAGYTPSDTRHRCSRCHGAGHNSRTCKGRAP